MSVCLKPHKRSLGGVKDVSAINSKDGGPNRFINEDGFKHSESENTTSSVSVVKDHTKITYQLWPVTSEP